MQYKQISRILAEIIGPGTSVKIVLATSKFLAKNEVLTKLGPYKKRSTGQLLWRAASDSTRSPEERWDAVEKLLSPAVRKTQRQVQSSSFPEDSKTEHHRIRQGVAELLEVDK
jgi:hypothetical protein